MAKISKQEVDAINATLSITIEKSDYEKEFNKELKKYQGQSNIKGFRKGKTPMSYIKKMFGKDVLMNIVMGQLQQQVGEATKDMELFGQPIPADDSPIVDIAPTNMVDYDFKFELGLVPEFEIEGVEGATYDMYKVEVSDDALATEFENATKRFGERTLPEDGIEDKDLVKVLGKEMDGDAVKEGGHEAEFSIAVDRTKTKKLANELKKLKKGDTIQLNVKNVEKDYDKDKIRKYILGIEDEATVVGDMFECEIIEVSRIAPAEMNQELFDKLFPGGEVTSEEEAKAKLKESLNDSLQKNADALLFRDVQKNVVEKNQFDIPETFLKKWIKVSNEKPISDEQLEKEFPFFAEELRWSVIRGKLIKKHELEVTEEEIRAKIGSALQAYGGGLPPEFMAQYVNQMMQDENTVRKQAEEVMGDKLFEAIKETVTTKDEVVDEKQLEEIVKKVNEEIAKENEERKSEVVAEEA